MDNYPDHLSPEFDEWGSVIEPFDKWWSRVSASYPHVPEEVARDWLHRHWHRAPAFDWLPSADYRFEKTDWLAGELSAIRINVNEFADDHPSIVEEGKFWTERFGSDEGGYPLAQYMVANGDFPVAPVIMDNRNGHLRQSRRPVGYYPSAFLLIEGHKRFQIASYLASVGKLRPVVDFWLMTRVTKT